MLYTHPWSYVDRHEYPTKYQQNENRLHARKTHNFTRAADRATAADIMLSEKNQDRICVGFESRSRVVQRF